MKQVKTGMIFGAVLMAAQMVIAAGQPQSTRQTKLEQQVRKELVTLPQYDLFDTLTYKVDAGTVTLMGKVTEPTLKSSAENVVKNIEGVSNVINKVDVLPLSPYDNQLRLALYHSIYGHTVLRTLAIRAVPPIHIIVENGHVTLEGYVANGQQKQIAGMQANSVSGVFSVTNNLLRDDQS